MVAKGTAKALATIKSSGNHPLHWAGIRGYPFILTYRGGYPAAFYNGDRSVSAILDWCMTLACEANYYERYNLAGGVQAEAAFQMSPVARYPGRGNENPVRTESSQYSTSSPIRGYNSQMGITYQGTDAAAQETAELRDEDQLNDETGEPSDTPEDDIPQVVTPGGA
jgi:hypothetical protein